MKRFIYYFRDYVKWLDKRAFITITVFTAVLVFINYQYHLDHTIRKYFSLPVKLIAWYIVSVCAFVIPYGIQYWYHPSAITLNKSFLFFLFIAPLLFAFKASYSVNFIFTGDQAENNYWNQVAYWPVLLLFIMSGLLLLWKWNDRDQPFYGLKTKGISWQPYWILLLLMVPLILVASTQPDFQTMYPKLQSIKGMGGMNTIPFWKKIIYELSYGTDFITIEFFFRGFLILGFVKWAGRHAILPMACFYCTIHFGKPLGECISSYFGGIILGILVYNTRSVLGGLMVHLGIAWLMELAGYLRL